MYKCEHCDKTFRRQAALINHMQIKHDCKVNYSSIKNISELTDPYSTARFKENGMYIVFNFSIYNLNN